jgi:hypothetical protein
LHWRIASRVSCQRRGVSDSAWSLIDQKSRAEQKRAKSQASDTGRAPSPWSIGRLVKKASAEKVVWTWRSPNRIWASGGAPPRAARTASGTRAAMGSPAPSWRPSQPSQPAAR